MIDLKRRLEKEFFPYVSKPARYLGNEYNIVHKDASRVALRVALCFPDLYELGMSHVGFEILYHVLNQRPEIWAERVYTPWVDAQDRLKELGIPLFSLESKTPLNQFHLVGFTLQYELTYTNILTMLHLGGIPLRAADRKAVWPLVIAGGPLTGNPEPLAEFMDAFLVGDGEEAALEICQVLLRARNEDWDKRRVLKELSHIPGMYIPSFYEPVYDTFGGFQALEKRDPDVPSIIHKRILPELRAENYSVKPLVPLTEITHDRLSLEIMRGCTEGCRFCSAGIIYRPVRQRPVSDIVEHTRQALANTGYDQIGLLSLNTSDYDELHWLMAKEKALVANQNVRFSFPSLRLDALTVDMVDFAAMVKRSGFTFAPEAGSQRLRDVINKNIREEDIFNTLEMVLENGWQLVKFYFMIGLPTETQADLEAIGELLDRVVAFAKPYGQVRFHVGVSPFSPKPHTPFQWEKQDAPQVLQEKIAFLQKRLTHPSIKLTWRDPYAVTLETILARGDRRMANVIEAAWQAGARFDGWQEHFQWPIWERALQQWGFEYRKLLEPISVTVPLPWDHIDLGVMRSFLQRERLRAYQGEVSPDCKDHLCLGCGLQRKVFENYVSCYRQRGKGRKAAVTTNPPSNQAALTVSTATETAPVRYGRRSRRRQSSTPLIKKRIRVQYTKLALSRFLSHLDIVRIFDRAARRAGIALVYSQGFHPHPRLSFGPPLAIGIASVAEYLDMEVLMGQEVDLKTHLNPYLPEGMEIVHYRPIYRKVPALAASINRSVYRVFLEGFPVPEAWIDRWLAQPEVWVERQLKDETRQVDIRPFVQKITVQDGHLEVVIDAIEGRSAKVTEVLQSLFEPHGIDYRQFFIQRTGQFIVDGARVQTPFDVID